MLQPVVIIVPNEFLRLQVKKSGINLYHLMDFGKGEFKIKVLNTWKIVKNMSELVLEAGEFV